MSPQDSAESTMRHSHRLTTLRSLFQSLTPKSPFIQTHTPSSVTQSKPTTLLILDSSFNPPTIAHETLFRATCNLLSAHTNISGLLLFATQNVDKKLTGSPAPERLLMMETLAKQFPSTSVGVMLHGLFLEKARVLSDDSNELVFVMGFDTLVRLFLPKYYNGDSGVMVSGFDKFFETARVVVADRFGCRVDGVDISETEHGVKGYLDRNEFAKRYREKIMVLEGIGEEVLSMSSTIARGLLEEYWRCRKRGGDCAEVLGKLRKIVPEAVLDVIIECELYK